MIPHKFMFNSPNPHPKVSLETLSDRCPDDPFLSAILEFCARWANKTEERMMGFDQKFDVAVLAAAKDANPDLISGVMVDRAVGIVADLWVYGSQFRSWADSQAGLRFRKELAHGIAA